MNKILLKTLFIFTFMLSLMSTTILANSWPQELKGDKGTIVIYQPQPEKLSGHILTGRAAMQLELKDSKAPLFGVFWFSSTIETERDTNSVVFTNIKVTKVSWPDSKNEEEQIFTGFVEQELQNTRIVSSLSKLTATLDTAENVKKSLDNIKNDPPVILFKDQLAVLLSYDGKPIFKDIENSAYQRAINTQFAVVKVKNGHRYYLTNGSLWYQASNELGPWKTTNKPPADLVSIIAEDTKYLEDKPDKNITTYPKIVTVTQPSELVVTSGKPAWKSLIGGKLLYVENTETPWIRDINTNKMYLLLSGRWFDSKSIEGPWTFVRPDKLPQSFKDIPPDSEIGGLRVSVADTDEANQAVLDAQIPQTAIIKRSETKLTVEYDGEPNFTSIKGTNIDYAINTNSQVLKINYKFYAVDNGVWFVSEQPRGPWIVADTIPDDEIAKIPSSSPVYNTTYVKVYDSTPEVVYVGYTPGYMWSYPYYGVPIYGTGWYYPPYHGGWYYPRPPTWGMHVGYNPWTGWSVGVSWGSPFFRVGISWGGGYHHHYRPCCGYYGGGHYRRGNSININGNINIGNSISIGNRNDIKGNFNKSKRNNLYNNPNNKHRNAKRTRANLNKAKIAPNRANNVFADKNGNVVRHQNGQWQNRNNKSWDNIPKNNQYQNRKNQFKQNSNNYNRNFNRSGMNKANRARNMGGMQRQMPKRTMRR